MQPRRPMAKQTRPRPVSTAAHHLVIMAKEPVAGRVKTRLASEIGTVTATWFYRHAMFAVIKRLSASSRWRAFLALTPATAISSPIWPRKVGRFAQSGGDLGDRMQAIMKLPTFGPIVIVGTDIPSLEAKHVQAAFQVISKQSRSVLGPTPDGGFYLVGTARTPRIPSPFEQVRWSSEHARADTIRNFGPSPPAQIACLSDVDTANDWRAVKTWSGRIVLPSTVRTSISKIGKASEGAKII